MCRITADETALGALEALTTNSAQISAINYTQPTLIIQFFPMTQQLY